jgi:hypothetical protein
MKNFIFYITLFFCSTIYATSGFVVTNSNDDGDGSLRQAIANSKATSGTITFSGTFTITLLSELTVEASNLIDGGSNTIILDGNNLTRVFNVTSNATSAEFRNITIRKGLVTGTGGGILNQGTLKLTNCTITNCSASSDGGGIFNNQGVLILTNCSISANTSGGNGGGIVSTGVSSLDLKLTNTVISNNTALDGGGIYVMGITQIFNSQIFSNAATNNGGGIWSQNNLLVRNSCLYSNTAVINGGALHNTLGESKIINSTISGNRANQSGGGIANGSSSNGGTTNLYNCTVSNNTADYDASSDGNGGGLVNISPSFPFTGISTLNISNSIIALNFEKSSTASDIYGSTNGSDYNLIGTITGATGTIGTGTDIISVTPKLGTLANNGGGTFTHALLSGSPAIDAGNPVFDIDAFSPALSYDQRDNLYPRILDGGTGTARIDIGAFEYSVATNIQSFPYLNNAVIIYPDPAKTTITIKKTDVKYGKYVLTLRNVRGQEVLSRNIEFSNTIMLDIASLDDGIYFITLENSTEKIMRKISVQH